MALKKSTRKRIKKIIRENYLTEWEFICNILAPEIEEDEFDEGELIDMLMDERQEREIELHHNTK